MRATVKLLPITLVVCVMGQEPATGLELSQIRATRKTVYCESCPAGRLKIFANFKLTVEQNNPATGGDFFPISDLTGKFTNLSYWREETWRSGRNYRVRVVSPVPEGFAGAKPGNYDTTLWHDGESSWKYRPISSKAEKIKGIDRSSQVTQDYYGDLIGSVIPSDAGLLKRTLQSSSELVYDLDQLLSEDRYSVIGEEKIAGEKCTIIDRPGLDRIWLAEEKNCPVVMREWRWAANGPLKRRIINSDFRHLGEGVWLPFAGRMEIFSHPSTVSVS